MAALTNTRHELFAIAIVSGKNKTQAYEAAGFNTKKNAGQLGSLLAQREDIVARIAELVEARTKFNEKITGDLTTNIAKQTGEVTREWIVSQLVSLVEESKNANQFGAANQALKMLGEHIGMFGKKTTEDDVKPSVEDTKAISVDRVNKFLSSAKLIDVT